MRRPGLRAVLVAVPLLGVGELAAHLYFAARPPDAAQWAALAPAVAAFRHSGELVVVAPRWADPLARAALGDEVFPLRDVARPDTTRYATAVELSILGESSGELAGWREAQRSQVGPFLLRRLDNPRPAHVVYDFADHLAPPSVTVRGTEPAVDCPWNPRARVASGGLGGHPTFPPARFECPGGPFFNVGVTVIADQDFLPRRCIWSHPLARGEIVTRFADVPLGSVVRGHGGMYWIVEREEKGAPVKLTVRVDGDTVGAVVHRDGDGWSAFELPLGVHAGQTAATVEFAVSSPDYQHRHYCFEADTR